ncbi:MAG: class I SAM-dependent methyltransferase [Chloroflexi bacterium]|nr:class I SAM-dependent methyltransferase [Chloroflexota bacterium]MCC6893202.1 class I SAM-dependent methyltransferase [Anaerolineae bacterium]
MIENVLPIYVDGRIYDQVFHGTADISYWRTQLEGIKGDALEVSCGTGRILLELGAGNRPVSGLDLSAGMLAYAAEKAQGRGVALDLHQGDMRDFDLGRTFAAITVPNNALGHLYTRHDVEAHLASVKRHLQPEGVYMLDMFVPNPAFLTQAATERSHMGQYTNPAEGAVIDIYQSGYYDPAAQIKHATWTYQRGDTMMREEPFALRMFYPQELDDLLFYNGFEIVAKYGDYDRTPFGSESKVQLIVARVR